MQGEGSRLLGLDGLVVVDVTEVCGQLDLQVELLARTGSGRRWRSRSVQSCGCVISHSLVGGRSWCGACAAVAVIGAGGRSPRRICSCRRVSGSLGASGAMGERVRGGEAHAEVAREERSMRYPVARAFHQVATGELGARRSVRPPRRCP